MKHALFILTLLSGAIFTLSAKDLPLRAYWDFTKGSIDSVDKTRIMRFRGNSEIGMEGKERFLRPGMTSGPQASGIECVKGSKDLSPTGSFRLEITASFGEATSNRTQLFLYDTKNITYVSTAPTANMGILLLAVRNLKRNDFYLLLTCGNGETSFIVSSPRYKIEQNKKYSFSAAYDEKGFVTFTVNGKKTQHKTSFSGALVPGFRRPVIGDRCGSHHAPFEGKIYSVKLFSKAEKAAPKKAPATKAPAQKKAAPKKPLSVSVSAGFSRAAFFRNEKNAVVQAHIYNPFREKVLVSKISCTVAGQPEQKYDGKTLTINPRSFVTVPVKVNTQVLVDKYDCTVKFTTLRGKKTSEHQLTFPIYICPQDFDRFSIYTEAVYSKAVENVLSMGMNERYPAPLAVFLDKEYRNAMEYIPLYMRSFDKTLFLGMRYRGLFRLMNDKWGKLYPRKRRDGKTYKSTEANNPELIAKVEKAAALGAKYLDHPVIADVNLNEEMRDMTGPSFNGHEEKAFKKFSSFDIPHNVNSKMSPVNYKTASDFPAERIISEKDPLYVYYQWFWRGGDGWPVLDGKIASIYKNKFKAPIKARYEPANRMPPIWYLDPQIDLIGNWSYLTPEPITVYATASELNAYAAQAKPQKEIGILGHITLIMYRGASAPRGQKVADEPSWVKKFPRASYITVSPDMITEALYLQFARKVYGVSFHGYNAIYDSTVGWGYICSNHETKNAMKKFFLEVGQRLGPLTKHLPEREVEVAALHSFASFVYAHRGSWGHQSWLFNSNLAMLRGNLMPGVIFEDQILRDGFGSIKVLLLPYCDVLPRKVADKIRDFQAKGGIVVGDSSTTPYIMPDLMLEGVERTGNPIRDKKALQDAGLALRKSLRGLYEPYTGASNPDLLTHARTHREADYLFVVNDKRTFGNYVGQYRLLQEVGAPNSGTVTIRRTAGAVYDVVKGKEVPFASAHGVTSIKVDFTTNDGRIYLLLPEKIGYLSCTFPARLKRGEKAELSAVLSGRSKRRIQSLHPLQLTVTMPNGKNTDESTYALFDKGVFKRTISIPVNAPGGVWKIRVKELASNMEKILTFHVD